MAESSPVNVNDSFTNSTYTVAGEFPDDPAKVFEIACESVHRVDDERVSIAEVLDGAGQLGPIGVLTAGLVGEHLGQLDSIELTVDVLVDRRHPLVSDALNHYSLRC